MNRYRMSVKHDNDETYVRVRSNNPAQVKKIAKTMGKGVVVRQQNDDGVFETVELS